MLNSMQPMVVDDKCKKIHFEENVIWLRFNELVWVNLLYIIII